MLFRHGTYNLFTIVWFIKSIVLCFLHCYTPYIYAHLNDTTANAQSSVSKILPVYICGFFIHQVSGILLANYHVSRPYFLKLTKSHKHSNDTNNFVTLVHIFLAIILTIPTSVAIFYIYVLSTNQYMNINILLIITLLYIFHHMYEMIIVFHITKDFNMIYHTILHWLSIFWGILDKRMTMFKVIEYINMYLAQYLYLKCTCLHMRADTEIELYVSPATLNGF